MEERLNQLRAERDSIMAQIAPAIQRIAFLDGQISIIAEMVEAQKQKKESHAADEPAKES